MSEPLTFQTKKCQKNALICRNIGILHLTFTCALIMVIICFSVVILVVNPWISGQSANKGFMIYYGGYRSQLSIQKSPKQNSCTILGHQESIAAELLMQSRLSDFHKQ